MNNIQLISPLPVRLLSILLIVIGILLLLTSVWAIYSASQLKSIGAQVLLGPNAEPLILSSVIGVILSLGLIASGFGLRRMQQWALYLLTMLIALNIATTTKEFNPTEGLISLASIFMSVAVLIYLWIAINKNYKRNIVVVLIILIVIGAAGWLYSGTSSSFLPSQVNENFANSSPDATLLEEKYTDAVLGFSIQPPKGWKASQTIGINNAETICSPSPSGAGDVGCLAFSRRSLSDLGESLTLTIDQIIEKREQEAKTLPDTLVGNGFGAAIDKGLLIFSKKSTNVVKRKIALGSVDGYLISAEVKASPFVKAAPRIMILAIKNGQQYMLEYDAAFVEKEIAQKNATAVESAFLTFQIN